MITSSNKNISALLALCAGNTQVTGEFRSQRPVTQSFDVFSFIYAWTQGWLNNRDAGGWRCHPAHYDVTNAPTTSLHELSNARVKDPPLFKRDDYDW